MTDAGPLFSWVPPRRDAFGGSTYDPKKDYGRLAYQSRTIFDLMKDGRWRTLSEIAEETGFPMQSVSARLRDFRKEKFGGHTVNRQNLSAGLHQYQLIVKAPA